MKVLIKSVAFGSLAAIATLLTIALLPKSIAYLHIKTTPCGAMVQFNQSRVTLQASPCRILASE